MPDMRTDEDAKETTPMIPQKGQVAFMGRAMIVINEDTTRCLYFEPGTPFVELRVARKDGEQTVTDPVGVTENVRSAYEWLGSGDPKHVQPLKDVAQGSA